jgi:8-oxo-dGTP pyrophosphatase MutT (NUDIX family)
MKLLKTIGEKDTQRIYRTRKAARAVVFDDDGNVALLYVSKHGYYKLPGGGVEEGEDFEEALKRECLEEIGCDVEIIKPIGRIVEYRHFPDGTNEDQESYCYVARVVGPKGTPHFEQGEIDKGYQSKWTTKNEAIALLRERKTNDYVGRFIVERDSTFVESCQED